MIAFLSGYVSVVAFILAAILLISCILWFAKKLKFKPVNETSDKIAPKREDDENETGDVYQISQKYFVIALLFYVFSAGIALLFPIATVFKNLGIIAAIAGVAFICVLSIPIAYLWLKGDI